MEPGKDGVSASVVMDIIILRSVLPRMTASKVNGFNADKKVQKNHGLFIR